MNVVCWRSFLTLLSLLPLGELCLTFCVSQGCSSIQCLCGLVECRPDLNYPPITVGGITLCYSPACKTPLHDSLPRIRRGLRRDSLRGTQRGHRVRDQSEVCTGYF